MDLFIISLLLFVGLMLFSNVGIDAIYRKTKLGFFVHLRSAPAWQVAFSAAASFMYVFAIVMTATFAITKGPSGSIWFTVPYVLTITYFGFLGYQLLKKLPQGFTFSEFIKERYGNNKVTKFYQILHFMADIYAIAANLTGFAMITEYVTQSFDYNLIVIIMGLTIIAYSTWGGIKASVRTDTIQMIMILFVSIVFGSVAVFQSGGLTTVMHNWSTAKPVDIFHLPYMLDPGLLLLLLFAGGIMATNGAYQKILSLGDKNTVIKTYFAAGFIMLVCYIGLTLLAASAFSLPITLKDPKLAGIQVTEYTLGAVGVVIFVLAVLSKAASSIDTALNSSGAIMANDLVSNKNPLFVSRLTMLAVMLIGSSIAMLKIDLWILITTFGTFRLLSVAPTLYALFVDRIIKTNTVFWSILITGSLGIYVLFAKLPVDKLHLSLVMIMVPACFLFYEHMRAKKNVK